MEQNRYFSVELVEKKMLNRMVLQLTFVRVDGHIFHFIPGQFITFAWDTNTKDPIFRHYSLANIPEGKPTFDIAISPVAGGFATQFFFNLQPGDALLACGPFGKLIIDQDPAPCRYVLVGTGTGIVPYRSALKQCSQLLEMMPSLEIVVLHGARCLEDLIYDEDFLSLAGRCDRYIYMPCLSRQSASTDRRYHSGYVQSYFRYLDLDPRRDVVYLCGNGYMVEESIEQLQGIGFTWSNVRKETYFNPKPLCSCV